MLSGRLFNADFFVGEVAGGIFGPNVAVDGFGSGAEVAAADVEESAFCTAAFYVGSFVFKLVQKFDIGVCPDFGERSFQYVAEYVVAPELVGADFAVPGNTAETAAGAVAFVELQEFENFFCAFGIFALEAHPQVGAVGVVVNGKHFFFVALVVEFAGFVHDKVYHGAGFLMIQVFVDEFRAAAGVHQVVETHAGNVALAQNIKNFGNFHGIALVDGEAQTDLDAFFAAVVQTFESTAEGTLHPAEMIVHLFAAVEGNAHIGKPHGLEFLGHGAVDEGAVGGDDGAHTLRGGIARQFRQILADGGFAAGKEHDRRAVGGEIVDHDLGLLRGDGVHPLVRFRLSVAVHAFKVAAARHVPDHHGLLVGGELEKVGRQLAGMAAVTQSVGRFHLPAVKLGNANHVRSSLVRVVVKSGREKRRFPVAPQRIPPFRRKGRKGNRSTDIFECRRGYEHRCREIFS